MPAQPQTEPSPTSTINEEVLARLARLKIKQDINGILLRLKNGKTCNRVLNQVLPGITSNDIEFVPTILWTMFGTSGPEAQPKYPQFPYPDNHRQMSLRDLERALKASYKTTLTYSQLRRVFAGLKRAKLVENVRYAQQDAGGTWTSVSSYFFNIYNWLLILENASKAPAVRTGKKRGPKPSVLDTTIKEAHRVKVKRSKKKDKEPPGGSGNNGETTPVFSGAPGADLAAVDFSFKGEVPISPGVVASESSARSSQLVAAPAEEKKEQASPAIELFLHRDKKEASSQLKAKVEQDKPCYVADPSEPGWQILLEAVLDYKVLNGQVADDWKTSLYNPEDGITELTLKPRIPDCTVLVPDEQSATCGVWSHDDTFIHLSPADLELGNLVERATGCPLRAEDWKQLARLAHRKATDSGRLTLSRLIALLTAFPDKGSERCELISDKGDIKVYTHCSILPEIFEKNSGQWDALRRDFHQHVRDEKLDGYLPFLHCDQVGASALLSPGNAGKLLFNWDKLWTAFREHTGPNGSLNRSKLSGIHEPSQYSAPETLHELDRGVRSALRVIPCLHEGLNLSSELTPLAHIQRAPQGVRSLLPETRQKLNYLMLRLYAKAPHIWCDLERWMGTETFAAAMPVGNVESNRANARARVAEMVATNWIEPV